MGLCFDFLVLRHVFQREKQHIKEYIIITTVNTLPGPLQPFNFKTYTRARTHTVTHIQTYRQTDRQTDMHTLFRDLRLLGGQTV